MTPVSFTDFLRALALKVVLARLGGSEPAPARPRALEPPAPRAAQVEPPPETQARPARAFPALALLTVGALSMLLFEAPVTRVIGVLALAAFVVAGVFAIADPRWLASAPDLGQPEESGSAHSG